MIRDVRRQHHVTVHERSWPVSETLATGKTDRSPDYCRLITACSYITVDCERLCYSGRLSEAAGMSVTGTYKLCRTSAGV